MSELAAWPAGEPLRVVSDRQLRSLTKLYALNEGWAFGAGPMQWPVLIDIQDEGPVLRCDTCSLSVFVVMPGFTWNLELLKSRVADHVLRCHPGQVTG